ncbi:MAG: hypothetical protein HC905_16055 [Bacteroidales bacterium]|nr:hypothetical protein [Bacteroidales bacterium]
MTSSEFEKIFKEQFPVLCNLAASVVKDGDEAKDIVQQVFLKLWQKKDDIVIKGPVAAYLYRAVVNTAFNHNSRAKKSISLNQVPNVTDHFMKMILIAFVPGPLRLRWKKSHFDSFITCLSRGIYHEPFYFFIKSRNCC